MNAAEAAQKWRDCVAQAVDDNLDAGLDGDDALAYVAACLESKDACQKQIGQAIMKDVRELMKLASKKGTSKKGTGDAGTGDAGTSETKSAAADGDNEAESKSATTRPVQHSGPRRDVHEEHAAGVRLGLSLR